MKSVQCGITEWLVVFTLAELMRGNFVLYAFPTDGDRDEFIHDRLDRVVDKVKLYTEGRGIIDNVGLKHFWDAGLYAVTTGSKTAFKSKTVQTVNIDELDQCNMDNLVLAKDRTAACGILLGREPNFRKVGNPTISGYGIHAEFEQTDKKYYHFQCSHCNEWQHLIWEKNVCHQIDNMTYELLDIKWTEESKRDINIHCKKCGGILKRQTDPTEWIAEKPGVVKSGYQISQLFTNQFSVRSLWNDFTDSLTKPLEHQAFINSKLGLPYAGSGEKLSLTDFDACCHDYQFPTRHEDSFAGVDVGNDLHVRIDCFENSKRKMLWAGKVADWIALDRLFERMGVRFCIIDALPEKHKAREFIKAFGHGLLCFFTKSERQGPLKVTPKNIEDKEISVNRTEQIDDATSVIIRNQAIIPNHYRTLDGGDWVDQMFAPTRILDASRNPPVYKWDSGGQPDHHRFADVYCNMAARLLGWGEAERVMIWL